MPVLCIPWLWAAHLHSLLLGPPSSGESPGREMENATSQADSPAGTWLRYHVEKSENRVCSQGLCRAAREAAVSGQTTPKVPHNGWPPLQVRALGTCLWLHC